MGFLHSLKFVILVFVGIFVAWGFTMIYEWHFHYWWVDNILHFTGGFWIFLVAQHFAEHYGNKISGEHKNIITFVIFISFVVFVGVLWEFFELVLDRYIVESGFTYLKRVFEDTLTDLLMDMFGGVTGFLLYFKNEA